jgi:hypothetical protein
MKLRKLWEANFLFLELILAGLLSLIFSAWSELINNGQLISSIFFETREVMYGALVALFGSMLGFSITAVSIVLGYATNDKLEIVRKSKHYPQLWKVFKAAIKVLALATVASLVGLIFDKDALPINFILYLNLFLLLLSVFRVARAIWVLENIIAIVTKIRN